MALMESATMSLDNPEIHALPDKLLSQIIHNLQRFPNETVDFSKPHLRESLVSIYPVFLMLYGGLVILGTIGNAAMVTHILRRRLYRDPTCAFIMNLGICNLIMSLLLLPLSLAILLIQNWIFGSFLCYFVPMLQDVPIHATMATLVFIALDRYLLLVHPPKTRVPPFIAVLAVWVLSVCIVLPYAVYMNYIDLQMIFGGKQFEGVGICTVNLGDDIAEYIRGLFVVMYVFPLALAAFLYVRVSSEIKCQEVPVNLSNLDSRDQESQHDIYTLQDSRPNARTIFQDGERSPRPMYPENSAILNEVDGREEYLLHDANQLPSFLNPSTGRTAGVGGGSGGGGGGTETPLGHHMEGQMDLTREKRNQKYLTTMTATIALCLCPLMILRLVKNMVLETYDNSGHFDITFITFVWVAFLPTVSTPALFATWKMPRSTKDRLEGYLRFSNRSHRSSSSHGGREHLPSSLHSHHSAVEYRMSLDRPQGTPLSSQRHPYSPLASRDQALRQEALGSPELGSGSFKEQQTRPQTLTLTS